MSTEDQDYSNNLNSKYPVLSLSFGIAGLISVLIPYYGFALFPAWIFAVIFGSIGRKTSVRKSMATVGLAMGILSFLYCVIFWCFVLFGGA